LFVLLETADRSRSVLFRVVWVRETSTGLTEEPVSTWFKNEEEAQAELGRLQQNPENAHKTLVVVSLGTTQERIDKSQAS
jgi:hypothetical protein